MRSQKGVDLIIVLIHMSLDVLFWSQLRLTKSAKVVMRVILVCLKSMENIGKSKISEFYFRVFSFSVIFAPFYI